VEVSTAGGAGPLQQTSTRSATLEADRGVQLAAQAPAGLRRLLVPSGLIGPAGALLLCLDQAQVRAECGRA